MQVIWVRNFGFLLFQVIVLLPPFGMQHLKLSGGYPHAQILHFCKPRVVVPSPKELPVTIKRIYRGFQGDVYNGHTPDDLTQLENLACCEW